MKINFLLNKIVKNIKKKYYFLFSKIIVLEPLILL